MENDQKHFQHVLNITCDKDIVVTSKWTGNGLFFITRRGHAFQLQSDHIYHLFSLPFSQFSHAAWSSEGKYLAVVGLEGVYLWDAWLGKQVAELSVGTGHPNSVCWSRFDRYLAVGARAIFVFDPASKREIACFDSHPAGVTGLDWSPDGSLLVSADDWGGIRVHNFPEGLSIELPVQSGSTFPAATKWSPCGRFLYLPNRDDGIRILEIRDNEIHFSDKISHRGLQSIAFLDALSEGIGLITKGRDGYTRVWNRKNREVAKSREQISSYVRSEISAHPYSNIFTVLGDKDTTIRIWEFSDAALSSDEVVVFEHSLSTKTVRASPPADPSTSRHEIAEALQNVELAKTTKEKGLSLEALCGLLFQQIPGFDVAVRSRNREEEFDLVIANRSDEKPWRDEGHIILVECKNWASKRGVVDYDSLYLKMQKRRARCKLGFLVSWNGFASTVKTQMAADRREEHLIVLIDGNEIRRAVELRNFPKFLEEKFRSALIA